MKKPHSILSFLAMSALYSFVVSLYFSHAFVGNTPPVKINSDTEHYSTFVSSHVDHHTPLTESLVRVNNNTPPSSLRNPFSEFIACLKSTEKLFFNTFSQYGFYAQNILIRFPKTDIIFPFHYFW